MFYVLSFLSRVLCTKGTTSFLVKATDIFKGLSKEYEIVRDNHKKKELTITTYELLQQQE
jgi:hypothetical protein